MIGWLRKISKPRQTEPSTISFTEEEIIVSDPHTLDVEAEIFWRAVTRVTYKTTADGSLKPDLFVQLSSEFTSNDFVVHDEMQGFSEFLDRLALLPGFDPVVATQALRNTTQASYVVWEAAP